MPGRSLPTGSSRAGLWGGGRLPKRRVPELRCHVLSGDVPVQYRSCSRCWGQFHTAREHWPRPGSEGPVGVGAACASLVGSDVASVFLSMCLCSGRAGRSEAAAPLCCPCWARTGGRGRGRMWTWGSCRAVGEAEATPLPPLGRGQECWRLDVDAPPVGGGSAPPRQEGCRLGDPGAFSSSGGLS